MRGACLSCSSNPILRGWGSPVQTRQQSPVCTILTGDRGRNLSMRVEAMNDIVSASTIADPSEAQLTWQILVGSLAGVLPFVVAGIEFTKRIVAQQKCCVCKGTGLVLRDNKYYFRCPRCGGFLPWQSWKRFFTG